MNRSNSRPDSAPGVPMETITPHWVPFPSAGGYLAGAILLVLALGVSTSEINEAINDLADTLLFAGAALVLASALPRVADLENRT